ncbi:MULTISPECIES: FecCD family ABC transporter permease [unclassified Microbacterium]|uniref:FecCD family ABC transporter permease n=1 Tax=unclassified Microbacterium TaxID=2609290 RepID=UPI0009F9AE5A|nr:MULTISPECIES: iron chelate uptake ABC transporter family permease subunit [unclassified Microbacterium]MXS74072.1 iron ABC transporter permease [Microbacterium sp. TL13]
MPLNDVGAPPAATLVAARRQRRHVRTVVATLAILVLLAVMVIASLAVGSRPLAFPDVIAALFSERRDATGVIVHDLRLPRTLTALLVGSALGVAGVLIQAATRNPLADPGLLGVNAGAAVGVVVAIAFFGVGTASGYVWFAFVGAAAAATAVYLAARPSGRSGTVGLVLAGIALSACLSAVVRIITLADDDTFDSFRFWAVGSFERRDPGVALQLLPLAVVGLVLAVAVARGLDQLRLGADVARSLGVSPALVLVASGAAITLLCAVATSAAGPLAFIGLLVAHVVRRVGPADLRAQLPLAALAGATLTLASDVIGRVIAIPAEVEAGIVAAFLGAPLLLWLVLRKKTS